MTWPDQVPPRGQNASSTRKVKPQTSNLTSTSARSGEQPGKPITATNTARGEGGTQGNTGDAGKGPNLRNLAPPPVTVSAPPEHTQKGGMRPGPLASRPWWQRPWGVANGPNQEHYPRHVLRFGSSDGLRVRHTVRRGRQETRLSRKDSPATHSVPDHDVGNGWSTWLRSRSICTKRVQMDGPYNRVTP